LTLMRGYPIGSRYRHTQHPFSPRTHHFHKPRSSMSRRHDSAR
jgi:hypothetical protein